MKLLSDWIILNLGATLAFSALWIAVVVVVAAFMGVRAGFVRVVGWVSRLFARKRDQAIKALFDVVTPVAIGGLAPQSGPAAAQWIDHWPSPAPDRFFEFNYKSQAPGAAMAHDERAQIGRYLADPERCMPSEAARMTDRINAGAGKPIVVGSAEWLASCPVRDWRGTGGAREDRETVIEATWQGHGRGFATTTLPAVQ